MSKQELINKRNETKCLLTDLRSDLSHWDLRADLSHWRAKRADLQKELVKVEESIKVLEGTFMGSKGRIHEVANQLDQLDIAIQDEDLAPVVWPSGEVSSEYVVEKITAKRIYIKKKGSAQSTVLDKRGYTIGSHPQPKINLEATLKGYEERQQ